MARFAGRSVLVTGAGGGIGRAIAIAFAQEGARVIVVGRRLANLEETVTLGGKLITAIQCDVSELADVLAVEKALVAEFGGLDVLVVNAAVPSTNSSLHEEPVESLDRIIATNIRGAFLVLQSGVRLMLASGGGNVIMIGSLGGLRPAPAAAAYGMSKAATHAMAKHAAIEYARNGIRANVIAPGATATPLLQQAGDRVREALAAAIPLGRIADPNQIASVAMFLASEDASHITGQILGVDGGTSLG